jgi:outer membrane protein OmpA-like peptidoglycan-associated protein
MKKNIITLIFAIILIFAQKIALSQVPDIIKKTADKNKVDLKKLEEMMKGVKTSPTKKEDSNPTNKTTQPNTNTKNTTAKTPSKYSKSKTKFAIDQKAFESNYSYLTAAEKEKVKDLPKPPEAIRNSEQAQELATQLANFDGMKEINAASKSIQLVAYYMKYYKLKQLAEQVVVESQNLEAAFKKNNQTINFGNKVGKTYTSENGLVYLPLGDMSFADEVVEANYTTGNLKFEPGNCLDVPNYFETNNIKTNRGIYSLGLGGSLIIKFTNNALVDVNGPDLFIFEAGEIEPTNLEISKDGKNWINVGKIEGGTASVDIKEFAKPNEYYYYVRLTDLNTKSTIAGADIDAVATIGAALRMSLEAEVLFDQGKFNLKSEGVQAIKKLAQNLKTISNALIMIEGHTDNVGTADDNQKLSLQRAQSVSKIFQEELKGNKNFIYKEIGKGQTEPAYPNTTSENKQKNRRVEIVVVPN